MFCPTVREYESKWSHFPLDGNDEDINVQSFNLLFHVFGGLDASFDIGFVGEVCLAGEGLVQAWTEVFVAQRVFASEVQELLVDANDLIA